MFLALCSLLLCIGDSAGQDLSGWMVEPNHVLSQAASKPMTVLSLGSDDPLGVAGLYGNGGSPRGDLMEWSQFHSLLGGHTSLGAVQPVEGEHHADWSSVLDPFMKDILDMMNVGLTQNLLPLNQIVKPCQEDIAKLCPEDKFKSPLHCLGQHVDKVSDACKKDVKSSLPYSCAYEISAGCDGLEKPIVACLTEQDKTKPLSKDCKSTLQITKTVIHKVNTEPITVLSLTAMNGTHIAANQTTRETHPPVWWECPAGFVSNGGSGLAQQEMPCCSATPEMKEPKPACAAGGGQWNLASHGGAHDGMQCCPRVSMIASESHYQDLPLATTATPDVVGASYNWAYILIIVAFFSVLLTQVLRLLDPKYSIALNSMINRGVSNVSSNVSSKIGSGKKIDGPVGQGQPHPSSMAEMIKRGTTGSTPPRIDRKTLAEVYEDREFDL